MLASLAILMIVLLVVLGALASYQRTFRSEQTRVDVQVGLDETLEFLEQEIGQAGYLGYTPRQLLASVVASPGPQVVPLSSTDSLFAGEKLVVDSGLNAETVVVQAVGAGSITAVFGLSHSAGATAVALGVFPSGVASTTDGDQLRLLGDLNADGTLQWVEYDCDRTQQALVRHLIPVSQTAAATASILLAPLAPNPNGEPCFRFSIFTYAGYTMVTAVRVTLTAAAPTTDPQRQSSTTMTASLVVVPRNVLQALRLLEPPMAQPNLLQPLPSWPGT